MPRAKPAVSGPFSEICAISGALASVADGTFCTFGAKAWIRSGTRAPPCSIANWTALGLSRPRIESCAGSAFSLDRDDCGMVSLDCVSALSDSDNVVSLFELVSGISPRPCVTPTFDKVAFSCAGPSGIGSWRMSGNWVVAGSAQSSGAPWSGCGFRPNFSSSGLSSSASSSSPKFDYFAFGQSGASSAAFPVPTEKSSGSQRIGWFMGISFSPWWWSGALRRCSRRVWPGPRLRWPSLPKEERIDPPS